MRDNEVDDERQLSRQMPVSQLSPNFLLITGLHAVKPFIPPMDIISFGILLSAIVVSSTGVLVY